MGLGPLSADRANEFSWLRGFIGGVAAFVVGYLLVYLLQAAAIERELAAADPFDGTGLPIPSTAKAVGWLFYGGHQVETRATVSGVGSGSETLDVIGGAVGTGLATVVVAVVLLAVGAAVAHLSDATRAGDGAKIGAGVAIGYFPLAVVGALATEYVFSAGASKLSIAPSIVPAALVAGILVPAVLGAVGGTVRGHTGGV